MEEVMEAVLYTRQELMMVTAVVEKHGHTILILCW